MKGSPHIFLQVSTDHEGWVAKVIIGDNDSSEHTVFVLVVMTMLIIIMKTMKIMIFIAHLHAPHRSDAVVPPR